MTDSRSSRPLRLAAAALASAGLLTGNAFADDSSPQKDTLPGVADDYRIAKPAPEPDDAVPGNGNGEFKIGDTDVRISGSITFDVGAGAVNAPRR
ncbi:hypothetical protein ABID19_004772 [Mesorhizobium robiniae]|uniref:Porin n=1 Tax=Mesorhizobium robiniae TaxID=559315 RepID=A0ABV2GTV4_9HYPH